MLSGLSSPNNTNAKSIADKAKLGGSYTLLMSALMLQISDPDMVWNAQKIISFSLMFISVLLAKDYRSSSPCSNTGNSTPPSETSNEPIRN